MAIGHHGDAVVDLQRRLAAAGCPCSGARAASYDSATEAAVATFQHRRGLRRTGVCDEQTWLALTEASWKLGDRILMLAAPQTRGDDVVELQHSLNHLGFDCGRPDGILGPATVRALVDFQRNSGILPDGACGPNTVAMITVLLTQSGTGPGVASIREHEASATSGGVDTLRIVVGQFGGLSSITRTLARALRSNGATVMSTDEYEAGAQAAAANRFGASVYLGFEAQADTCSNLSYFAVPTFESVGGRALASNLAMSLEPVLPGRPNVVGMRLAVLRETRMPAVLCTLGPVRAVVDATDHIAEAVVTALQQWSADENGQV